MSNLKYNKYQSLTGNQKEKRSLKKEEIKQRDLANLMKRFHRINNNCIVTMEFIRLEEKSPLKLVHDFLFNSSVDKIKCDLSYLLNLEKKYSTANFYKAFIKTKKKVQNTLKIVSKVLSNVEKLQKTKIKTETKMISQQEKVKGNQKQKRVIRKSSTDFSDFMMYRSQKFLQSITTK
ncbi:lob domain-containing protein 24-like [Anaeramoeba flamelloides]|uniref:Lob domain-containing protein 24-like n=1 Tax=Anaeramoeba flamelloides TaxID=1746091 RepID=A0AAV8AAK7_9EUKA|nr:lob domain-containing protein 24-like [Anaeramoeba flamelloides]